MMLGLVTLTMGCETTGPAIDQDTICAGWRPVLVSRDDVLSNETAQDILAHNEFGAAQGCWSSHGDTE